MDRYTGIYNCLLVLNAILKLSEHFLPPAQLLPPVTQIVP
jgi:hypothetical protein